MADSSLSASELKRRYHRGGSIPDDQLTSAQVRARHGIPSNRDDFASSKGGGGSFPIAATLAVVLVVLVLFFLMNKETLGL
jgi:hypothetical protein